MRSGDRHLCASASKSFFSARTPSSHMHHGPPPVHSRRPSVTSGPALPPDDGRLDIFQALSSPVNGVKKSLQIDMKGLIGDAVGNVSAYLSAASMSLRAAIVEHKPVLSRRGPSRVGQLHSYIA